MVSKGHKLSVRRQCKLLTLTRSHLYYEPKGESAENLRFMEIIDKQFLETPWYGSRQMARYMKRNNHKCGRHRMRRLMRLMRLVPIYQEPNTSKKHPRHKIWPYLLRKVVIDRPNQVWCADITYIPMRRGFLYLVAIMDWYSRKVLAWRLSNSMDADFCVEALKEARAKHGKPEIFNTDQGSQFTSGAWVIPPFLTGCGCRTYAAIFSFCAGVIPPMPIFGRSTARQGIRSMSREGLL